MLGPRGVVPRSIAAVEFKVAVAAAAAAASATVWVTWSVAIFYAVVEYSAAGVLLFHLCFRCLWLYCIRT